MATTSSILASGKAMAAGRGGDGKGSKGRAAGLVATAALGLSLVAGGLLSQGRPAAESAQSPTGADPFAGDTHVATVWDFREDRRVGATVEFAANQFTYREDRRVEVVPQFAADQFTYREDRRVENVAAPTPRLDWETIRIIEQNQLPELTNPAPALTPPGPANFSGEDH